MALEPYDCGAALCELINTAQKLNEAVAKFNAETGLRATLGLNGLDYADRVGVRIEGDLIDAYAKPEPSQ